VHVTPPGPCSRCGERVPATSLFCPQCGQSMLRPRSNPAPVVEDVEPRVEETKPEPLPEPEVNSTTGWLRRSLNLGRKPSEPASEKVPAVQESSLAALQETPQMSLFDIEQAEAVAEKKKTKRPPAGARFVLVFSDGTSITVGERPGVMGVKPLVEDEETYRICLDDDTDTVAPEHLEFGVDNGVFWVQDLKTVNGTVVREPETPPVQCIPYERYFVVRGSTVSLGALSFSLN